MKDSSELRVEKIAADSADSSDLLLGASLARLAKLSSYGAPEQRVGQHLQVTVSFKGVAPRALESRDMNLVRAS